MNRKHVFTCCVLVLILAFATGCPKRQGSLKVAITPDEAVAAGAQWQVDGGAWKDSGETVSGLSGGDHVLSFKETEGWYTPASITATVTVGSTANVTVAYMERDPNWEEDSFTYDVDVAPDVVTVDEDHLGLLVASDDENYVYTFDAAGVEAAGLDLSEGKALIIYGIAIRRITSVTEDGGNLVVETELVPLNEVFTDGTIAWDYGVEFTSEKIRYIEVEGKRYPVPKDGTPIEISFEIGEYKYELKATLDGETSTFEFTVSKGLGATVEGKFVASGKIVRFRSKNDFELSGGKLQSWQGDLTGMRGDATLELIVAASGSDAVNYKLPVPIMKIPFAVGPIPVVLNIKAQFVINASVPYDGSARVKTGFTYDSDLGLTFNGTSVSAGGSLAGVTFGEDDTHETGASSAISANFGIGFPRVEVSVAGDTLVPWAQTAFLVGGSYTFTPACQTADAEFLGAMGYDLGIFGFNLLSGSYTLFDEKKPLLRSGDCPEDSKTMEEMVVEDLLVGADALAEGWK